MNLAEKIKAIHGNQIFNNYIEDAIMYNNKVVKDNKDVGLTDSIINYFYIRDNDKASVSLRTPKQRMTSCNDMELVEPKILVIQFKGYELAGVLIEVLRQFDKQENIKIETRKPMVLQSEIGEVKPFDRHLIKIEYNEINKLSNCDTIICEC